MHVVRWTLAAAAALAAAFLLAPEPSARSDEAGITTLTSEEFYAAAYYRDAQEHPKIKKMANDAAKLNAIAKDLHLKPEKLKAAIAKVESLGGDPAELAAAAVKEGFEQTRVKGRVLDVLVNAQEPKHVVVYVRWQASKKQDVVKEASEIAHTVAARAPMISTLSLAAIHPKAATDSKDAVWSAKIGRDRMQSIQEKRIEDYADKLYGRLFEVVDDKPF